MPPHLGKISLIKSRRLLEILPIQLRAKLTEIWAELKNVLKMPLIRSC
jgi:hypothetical protein